MAKKLNVNGTIFEYPTTGSYNWGEEAAGWAEEVTTVLGTLSGPEDIQTSEATLSNGGSGNVPGLSFNSGVVQQILVQAVISRTYTDATPTETESFTLQGAYNGSTFSISSESVAVSGISCGVSLDINNSGQITYVAESRANTNLLNIKFKATAIIQ